MRTIWIAEQRRRDERIKREALGLHGMVEEEAEDLSLGKRLDLCHVHGEFVLMGV